MFRSPAGEKQYRIQTVVAVEIREWLEMTLNLDKLESAWGLRIMVRMNLREKNAAGGKNCPNEAGEGASQIPRLNQTAWLQGLKPS
jgi:hypothetical protein